MMLTAGGAAPEWLARSAFCPNCRTALGGGAVVAPPTPADARGDAGRQWSVHNEKIARGRP
jgi:hypothetical protein